MTATLESPDGWHHRWHVRLVGFGDSARDTISTELEAAGCRVSACHTAEGVITAAIYDPAAAYVATVALPGEPFHHMVRWLRADLGTRGSIIIGVAGTRDEERDASATSADYVLRAPWTTRALARELRSRIEVEWAVAHCRAEAIRSV